MNKGNQSKIIDRAIKLIELAGLDAFAPVNSKEYYRWSNIKRGKARLGTEELEKINEKFPAYRWWLSTGEVLPEVGQTSPDYDEANRNLSQPNAG